MLGRLTELLPVGMAPSVVEEPIRRAMATALEPADGVVAVVVAHVPAQFLDAYYGHTFNDSLRLRIPISLGWESQCP